MVVAGSAVTLLGFIYLMLVLTMQAVPLNPATWILWTVLDAFIAYSMVKAQHPSAKIMVAFTIGAGIIALLSIRQLVMGTIVWQWGTTETFTAICFAVLFVIRLMSASHKLSINMGATAMFVAGIPMLIDSWNKPEAQDALFWGMSTFGWLLTLSGTKKSFTGWYMPVGGAVFNGLITVIALGLVK